MYPSNSHSNGTLDQSIPYKHSIYDITQNSKQENPPSSPLFYLPSPYIPYEDDVILLHNLHDLLLQQQLPTTTTVVEGNTPEEAVTSMTDSIVMKNDRICQQMLRKRTSKKDRHSKIDTAQGPRDRRMRLSLKVAGEFFGLQDMLGFDKASKTVEWLLNKSKMAIKELTRDVPHMKQRSSVGINSASSASDCEDVSGIDESAVDGNPPATRTAKAAKPSKEKRNRAMRKSAFHPLAKESREKARARARERTRAKRLGSWNPFEKGQEEETGTQSRKMNPSLGVLAGVEEPPRSSIIFNYDQQHNPGISQEQQHHQFTDFHYGKPWEAYNNINLC